MDTHTAEEHGAILERLRIMDEVEFAESELRNADTEFALFLGANIGDVHGVDDAAFAAFLRVHVTPVFPGFTVRTSVGFWNGEPETVRELVILASGDALTAARVATIARSYGGRFSQDSVLVTERPARVSFVSPVFRVGGGA